LFDAEQYKEAAEAYKYRIAINDGDSMNHFQCGLCYSRIGQWEDALHYYELQEKNFPLILMDNKEFYLKLKNKQAECLMKMGKFEDALRICTKALKIDPNNFQITVRTAQCYNFLNDNENAIVYLLKALEMNNNHRYNEYENLFGTIGDIFSEISQDQNPKEKEESISNAILAYKKSIIFLNLSDNADNKDFEDLQYTNAMNLLKIGRSYMLIGKYIDALINLQIANYINTDMPTLQLTLSICYYYLDFVKESLMHFELIPADELKEFKTLIPDLVEIEKLYKERNK
jgi:tetratricopeptide repeat containing protein